MCSQLMVRTTRHSTSRSSSICPSATTSASSSMSSSLRPTLTITSFLTPNSSLMLCVTRSLNKSSIISKRSGFRTSTSSARPSLVSHLSASCAICSSLRVISRRCRSLRTTLRSPRLMAPWPSPSAKSTLARSVTFTLSATRC